MWYAMWHWNSSRAAGLLSVPQQRPAALQQMNMTSSRATDGISGAIVDQVMAFEVIVSAPVASRQASRHGPGLWPTSPASSDWPLETSTGPNSMTPGNPIVLGGAESLASKHPRGNRGQRRGGIRALVDFRGIDFSIQYRMLKFVKKKELPAQSDNTFESLATARISDDVQRYLNYYSGENINNTKLDKNLRFYSNCLQSVPNGESCSVAQIIFQE